MEVMTKFVLTGEVSGMDHQRITTGLTRRWVPWRLRQGPIAVMLAYLVVVYIAPVAVPEFWASLPLWTPAAGLAVLIGVLIVMFRARQRAVWTALDRAPIRQGVKTFALTPDGLRIKGATGYSFTTWTGFVDVIDDPQGVLVLTGPMDYIVLPQAMFDTPEQKKTVVKQIAQWIAGARD